MVAGIRLPKGRTMKLQIIVRHMGSPFLEYGPNLRLSSAANTPRAPQIREKNAQNINARETVPSIGREMLEITKRVGRITMSKRMMASSNFLSVWISSFILT